MEEAATTNAIGPGTVIADTYRIERALGEGGMGLVFAAQHLRVPKRVAIKVLRTALDADLLARFRQEAEIASRIGHPNIVDVLDFNTLPSGTPYLVMELLDGESLASRARRGPVPLAEALAILRQIASALHAAHNEGVVHRDLKPENVFLVPRELTGAIADHVKILDFGISKVHGSAIVRTSENVVMGTPRYMAPEQALGLNHEIDARADQFALAVIAFELLAGTPPFDDDNETKVMFKIVYEEPRQLAPLAPDTPAHVVAAIERALSKRPQDRFEDMSELVHALTGKPFAIGADRARVPSLQPTRSTGDGVATAAASPRARPPEPAPTVAATPRARASDAPTVESPPPIHPTSRRWWPLFAALAVGAAGALVVVLARDTTSRARTESRADRASVVSAAPSAPLDASVVVANVVTPDAAAVPTDVTPDAAAVTDTTAVPATPRDTPKVAAEPKHPAEPRAAALTPEVEAMIKEAETLLAQGKLSAAKSVADRARRDVGHARVFLVLVEIACRLNDLDSALGHMRSMPASARPAARKRCKAAGFELQDPN